MLTANVVWSISQVRSALHPIRWKLIEVFNADPIRIMQLTKEIRRMDCEYTVLSNPKCTR